MHKGSIHLKLSLHLYWARRGVSKMHKIQRNHSTGIKMSKIKVFLNQACRVAYVFLLYLYIFWFLLLFCIKATDGNRWLFFSSGQKFKKYCESNQHQICICMCTSINRLWYFYLVLEKKYCCHKNYCSAAPKALLLKATTS